MEAVGWTSRRANRTIDPRMAFGGLVCLEVVFFSGWRPSLINTFGWLNVLVFVHSIV